MLEGIKILCLMYIEVKRDEQYQRTNWTINSKR